MSEPTWKKKPLASALPRAWALEPRLMFDAAAAATATEHVADASAKAAESQGTAAAETQAAATAARDSAVAHVAEAQGTARQEVVFVDSGITDYQALLRALPAGAEVVMLDAHQDGFAQMAQYLQGRQGLDAIHLISEGERGAVRAGSTLLDLGATAAHAADLQRIGAALGDSGDLLLYGCNVGQGSEGAALLQQLATLTRADIAASTNWSGGADKGADWQLEAQTGSIESAVALDLQRAQAYGEVLGASATITSTGYDATTGVLTVTGTNFTPGETIDVSKLTVKGQGGVTYQLTSASIQAQGATEFTVQLNAMDQANLEKLFNKNGTASLGNNPAVNGGNPTTYNLAATPGWDGSAAADYTNAVAVSGLQAYTQLTFDSRDPNNFKSLYGSGTGTSTGDVMLFKNVVTVDGQQVDAVVKTTLTNATFTSNSLSSYDSNGTPGNAPQNFQPLISTRTGGGSASFVFEFYKSGTYTFDTGTQQGSGTAVTLHNVLVNSYDIDSAGSGYQYQDFKGFAHYELATTALPTGAAATLNPMVQSDGSVRFQALKLYDNTSLYGDNYRVRVFYDTMNTFQITTGVADAGAWAYFSLEFNVGPDWGTPTTVVDTPASHLTYSTTRFTEAVANDGTVTTTSTITLVPDGLTNINFTGNNGDVLNGVTVDNVPAGLTAVVRRVDDKHVTLSFTGSAAAHANANDLSNVKITFGNAAFTTGNASTVTGTMRDDLSIDFNDPPPNAAPVNAVPGTVLTVNEDAALAFTSANTISVSDVDGNLATSQLTVTSGRLGVTLTGGATISAGANGSATLTLSGTQAAINATLATLTYQGNADFNGSDTLTVVSTDSGAKSDTDTVAITVAPVNDAPVNTVPATVLTVNEDAVLAFTGSKAISVSDADGNLATTQLTVTSGRLGVTLTGGATISAGANGSATLTLSGTQAAINATLATLTYQGNANFNGNDTLTVKSTDGTALSDTDTVGITVAPVNDAPVNTLPTTVLTVNEDAVLAFTGSKAISVSDIDGNLATTQLTVTNGSLGVTLTGGATISAGANGSTTLTLSGTQAAINATLATLTYQGSANFSGTDTLTIVSTDGAALSDIDTVGITVTPVNDAPVANPDTLTVAEDSGATVLDLKGNDTDPDGDALSITSINGVPLTGAAQDIPVPHGTVHVAADGTVSFIPEANYNGPVGFDYVITDGTLTSTATVSIAVTPANDPPVADDDSFTVSENSSGNALNVLDGDTDIDGDTLSVSSINGVAITGGLQTIPVANGMVQVGADGTITFSPAPSYRGPVSFDYTVTDGHGGTDTGTVNITVTRVNEAPVAHPDTLTVAEDSGATVLNLKGNDTDADGDALSITSINGVPLTGAAQDIPVPHGTVHVAADGTLSFTPEANYAGPVGFNYTVTDGIATSTGTVGITVTPVNDAPVARPDTVTVAEDSGATVLDLKANDTDVDGDALSITSINGVPLTGAAQDIPVPHGTVHVAADGTVSFIPEANYTGPVGFDYVVTDGTLTSTATVSISVIPVNDAPVANPDAFTVAEDSGATVLNLKGNDTDADGDTLSITSINGVPLTGAAQDIPVPHGTVHVAADGTVSFIPETNYTGPVGFNYVITDGTLTSTATVSIAVTPVNDAPVAHPDSLTVAEDSSATVLDLKGNDTDPDGDALSITSINGVPLTGAAQDIPVPHGTVHVTPGGVISFTPEANYNGPVGFDYTVTDGTLSSTGTVSISVTPANDAPVAHPDTATVAQNSGATVLDLKGNDTDPDGDPLSIQSINGVALTGTVQDIPVPHGTVHVAADGTVSFIPEPNYTGPAGFDYVVTDGSATSTATVSITVTEIPPVAVDSITVNEASPYAVFTVTGTAGQSVSLVLAGGSATGAGVDFGSTGATNLQVSTDGGTTWATYTGAVTLPAGGVVLARTPLVDDQVSDNGETFTLSATPAGGQAATGTATIRDDGTGDVFKDNGSKDPGGHRTDDRPVSVNSITVNEASPYAVFTVTGTAGQSVSLVLAGGSATGAGVDFGSTGATNLQVSTDGGTTWATYTGAVTLPAGGVVLARTPLVDDQVSDNGETFTLSATPAGGQAGSGTATIRDDGTGDVFKDNGSKDPGGRRTDDRPVSVNSITVNEASPYAVFTVTGSAGQSVSLALAGGSATGAGVDFGSTGATNLQVSTDGGATWVPYTGAVTLPAGGVVLARTPLVDDGVSDNGEICTLTATPAGGQAATGTATIRDDGTGDVFKEDGSKDPNGRRSDDRPVSVNSITVNEASPYAVFTVTGSAGQSVSLALAGGSATGAGVDFGSAGATNLQVSTDGGATWVPYTGAVTLPAGGVVLARTPLVDDGVSDNGEICTLTATPAGGQAATGTATIRDDGTGDVFKEDGSKDPNGRRSDDRPVNVNSITVNEASPYAVFTVTGSAGQSVTLALAGGSATGAGVDFGSAGATNLQVSTDGGATWVPYTGAVTLPAGGAILVRTPLVDDGISDNGEICTLTATPAGGQAATGTATIRDDGTGDVFKEDGSKDPNGRRTDDRPVKVDSITVTEGSPYAVFTVTGSAGQSVTLVLRNGTAQGGGVDFGNGSGSSLQVSTDGGATWGAYTGGAVTLPAGGAVLVRTPVVDDKIVEDNETFTLEATLVGGPATTSTATIVDNDTVPPVLPVDPKPAPSLPPAPAPLAPADSPILSVLHKPADELVADVRYRLVSVEPVDPDRDGANRNSGIDDIYTRSSGFRVMVTPAKDPLLRLFNGVSDQVITTRQINIQLPADVFVHTDVNETVTLTARQANGQPLPGWLHFDGKAGTFKGEVPAGQKVDLRVIVTGRDTKNREANAVFRILSQPQSDKPAGRVGLDKQFMRGEALAHRDGQWQAQRHAARRT